jgi:Zn-dependent peptidase ImmA (M78 family)
MAAKTSPVTPSVVEWAIQQDGRHLADVAGAAGVDAAQMRAWITGDAQPTVGQVTAMAKALHRPRVFFFLPAPPQSAALPTGFRHPPGGENRKVSSTALVAARRARRVQHAVAWATRNDPPPDVPEAKKGERPEHAAIRVREWLGIPLEEEWDSDYAALRRWRTALEDAGVLVFALQLGVDEVRGFASWDTHAPLIVINTSGVSPAARNFTIGHELGHLLQRQATACLEPSGHLLIDSKIERWCERFAAALLMPHSEMLKLAGTLKLSKGTAGIDAVRTVMNRFFVSARAAALRLLDLELGRESLYAEVLAVFRPKRQNQARKDVRRPPRYTQRLRQYGSPTVSLVLQSLPPTEALSILRMTVEDARRLADEVPGVPAL